MKPVRVAPEAARELADAALWYETQRTGLSNRFLAEIESAQQQIQRRPASFPLLQGLARRGLRRALLGRFPYAIVFLEFQSHIRILAIAHIKREPGYWLGRLEP